MCTSEKDIFLFVKYIELYDITEETFVDGEIEKRNSTKIMKRIFLRLLVVKKKIIINKCFCTWLRYDFADGHTPPRGEFSLLNARRVFILFYFTAELFYSMFVFFCSFCFCLFSNLVNAAVDVFSTTNAVVNVHRIIRLTNHYYYNYLPSSCAYCNSLLRHDTVRNSEDYTMLWYYYFPPHRTRCNIIIYMIFARCGGRVAMVISVESSV